MHHNSGSVTLLVLPEFLSERGECGISLPALESRGLARTTVSGEGSTVRFLCYHKAEAAQNTFTTRGALGFTATRHSLRSSRAHSFLHQACFKKRSNRVFFLLTMFMLIQFFPSCCRCRVSKWINHIVRVAFMEKECGAKIVDFEGVCFRETAKRRNSQFVLLYTSQAAFIPPI